MKKNSVSRIILTVLLSIGLVFVVSGCAKKPAETVAMEEPCVVEEGAPVAEEALEEAESVIEEVVVVEEAPLVEQHVVKKGECLWWIAEYEDVYNDPFMWPLIYNANKDKIKNPDLIYPGQEFSIPRAGYTEEEIKESRKSAGAPRPYTPPEGALVPAY
jgi:nucleoid-associated protein YgaU